VRDAGSARVIGVDVARGLALLGMFAVHIFDTLHADNTPSLTVQVMGGHAFATFVMLAGVSLTFITKRRSTGPLLPDAAALTARALLVTAIGLALNSALDPDIDVILPYYGVMFLFAIPLLRRGSRFLVWLTIAVVLVGPLLVLASYGTNLPDNEPTLADLGHPLALLSPLLVNGTYPAVAYIAFICVGMVIGRLDLADRRVAIRLVVGGTVLAAVAWYTSTLILFHFGGLEHLRGAAPPGVSAQVARNYILWDSDNVSSWWWLAERSPVTASPLRMLHDIGVATAWLGLCLLVTRSGFARRALGPLAAAGAMTLTLYTVQVIILSTPVLDGTGQIATFVILTYGALSFAVLWRRGGRRGPLEAAVTWTSKRARELVESRQRARRFDLAPDRDKAEARSPTR
jgi:uncharacterized membrane protein YeiB